MTFIYAFKEGDYSVDEYIHCKIVEWVETDHNGNPTLLKVNQITNLEKYSEDSNSVETVERLLKVDKIKPIIVTKNNM